MTSRDAAATSKAISGGKDRPLVTIITVVLNRAATLERTVRSVLGQTYEPIEYVVVDGGSTDGTLEIIRRYEHAIAHWQSGRDGGISDAFNKGLAQATGAYIGLLNADDWLGPDHVATAVAALERTGADFVFGDLAYHDAAARMLHVIAGDSSYAEAIDSGVPDFNHPTLLAASEVYRRIGGFAPDCRFAMDYDWLLRAHRAGFRGVYQPGLLGHMTLAGTSERQWRAALAEVRQASIRHGLPRSVAWRLYFYRLAKGLTRRSMARLAPGWLHDALRRRVNRRFRPQV